MFFPGQQNKLLPQNALYNNGANVMQSKADYSNKQLDAQMVVINSIESQVQVSLPYMIPNFVNIQEALGQGGNDIYYQVQSFRYKNRFYNVRKGWAIEIRAAGVWDHEIHQDVVSGEAYADSVFVIPICSDYGAEYYVMTEDEIVQQLNNNLRYILWRRRAYTAYDDITSYMNLLNILANMTFAYDQLTGKLSLTLYSGEASLSPIKTMSEIGAMTYSTVEEWRLEACVVTLQTFRKMSREDQAYLATIMGFVDTYIDYRKAVWGDRNPIYEIDDELLDEIAYPYIKIDHNAETNEQPEYYWYAYFNLEEIDMVYRKKQVPEYKDFMKMTPPFVTKFAPKYMVSSTINQIQIHASLLSNVWNQYGLKTNVIETIPILERSISDQIQTYEPPSAASRVCNVRDSINSLQTFNVYFTDYYEQMITFTEPYELKIAIFFK